MIGYILTNDNRIRKLKEKTKIKNKQVKMILLEEKSQLFGLYYFALSPESYKKLLKIKQSKISYDFINGEYTGSEDADEDGLFEHIKYVYNINPIDIFTKIFEICVAENILNDSFWLHSAFYTYIFTKLKLVLKTNKKKYSYNNIDDMFSKLHIKPILNINKKIAVNDDKYKISKGKDIRNTDFHLVQIMHNVYIPVNTKLLKAKKVVSNISVTVDDEIEKYEIHSANTKFNNLYDQYTIFKLLCDICAKDMIETLSDDLCKYRVPTSFVVNKKKLTRKKFKNKYYLGM